MLAVNTRHFVKLSSGRFGDKHLMIPSAVCVAERWNATSRKLFRRPHRWRTMAAPTNHHGVRIMRASISILTIFAVALSELHAGGPTRPNVVSTPMLPPPWAPPERRAPTAHESACREFYAKYFDERGWLLCVERWGGDDGPDDAIENCTDWPILHALGGHDDVLKLYKRAWEGHLRQYTLAKTKDVPFARDGMYY